MRMSDTLGQFTVEPEDYKNHGYLKKYLPAIEKISAVTGISAPDWRVFEDCREKSALAGGKSSCAFLAARFNTLAQAFGVMTSLQRDLPSVNLELYVAPDGRLDQGDGIGSFDDSGDSLNQALSRYIQNEGFGVSVLVDIQNVNRHLKLTGPG